jgi:16S rRNA pseudouridine516 synthase
MVQALGNGKRVLYLRRISMGEITLDPALAPGEYRLLTEEELAKLKGYVKEQ